MKIRLLFAATALLITASVAAAQSDAQALLLAAFENTQALETFTYESETVILQTIGAPGMGMENAITQTATTQGQRVGDTLNLSTISESSLGSMMGEMSFGFELIYVDEVLYARGGVGEAEEGSMGAMMGDIFAGIYPEEWTNITEAPDAYPALSIYANTEALLTQFADPAGLYLSSEAALANLEELEAEELDGVSVRVFQFSPDVSELDQEALAAISDAVTSGMNSGTGGGTAGVDMEGMIADMMENLQLTITLYIDEAEGLIVQAVAEQATVMTMNMEGMDGMSIDQTSTTTTRLIDYNTDIVIEAPIG